MIVNENDRRVRKTRQIIFDAFFSLMKEKEYDKITVQEIIERADVGRSTFYSHFETRDELLNSSIEHMMNSFNSHMSNSHGNIPHDGLISVADLFNHIKENHRLMKSLIKGKSSDIFIDKVQASLNKKIEEHLYPQLADKSLNVPLDILINFLSSTLIFTLKWWLDNKMQYSPEQMEKYYYELITPSVMSIKA